MSNSFGFTSALTTNGAGMGTGIDVNAMVEQQMKVLRQPETLLQDQQTTLSNKAQILAALNSGMSTLQTSVQQFTDPSGSFNNKTASSSNSAIVSATAANGAATGIHTVTVNSLALTGSYSSDPLADSSTTFAEGTFSIKVGTGAAASITVNSTNNTLAGLAASINKANAGVTASVITDASGARLALVSKTSGSAGDITISGNTTGLNFNKGATGADASLTVDGISITSSSNIVKTVIPGLTLNLNGTDKNQTVTISVNPDVSSMNKAVHDFVDNYNVLIKAINNQFGVDPTTQSASELAGDTALQVVQQQLLTNASYSMSGNGGINSLLSLGVSMNNDGTLTVNDTTLNSALSSQYTDVQNFFQGVGSFGHEFNTNLYHLTDPLTGAINVELTGIRQTQDSLADHITDFEARLTVKQQQLTDEYSKIDTILQQLPVTLSRLSAQLGSLKG